MGLEGELPESVDTFSIQDRVNRIYATKQLNLRPNETVSVNLSFDPGHDMVFHMHESLPKHPNGMRFCVFDKEGTLLATNKYYSIGGGFVVPEEFEAAHENIYYRRKDVGNAAETSPEESNTKSQEVKTEKNLEKKRSQDLVVAALPFKNAADLLEICQMKNLSIAQVVLKNELQWQPEIEKVKKGVLNIWNVMNTSISNGIHSHQEYLPGDLRVKRRAPSIYKRLMADLSGFDMKVPNTNSVQNDKDPSEEKDVVSASLPSMKGIKRRLPALDWLSLYAIAVNEENAAGGRVVTAPTNGAAGVIPSVLKYYLDFISTTPSHKQQNEILDFMLTSAAIGMLYKRGSSISAAEVGCQGEVGVACSMAAAALCSVMGGTPEQVENAAEIGMEHNLGLTCDPVGGLVQIPCIERNALGAVKAVAAAQLSLNGDGVHRVSLDQVIETMRLTGLDMQDKYKETSLGGLAVSVPIC